MYHRISIALRKLRQDLAHRMGLVGDVHHHLEKGDVLVGDRGFCSFLHLAMLAARSVHAVIRVHARQIVDFNPHRSHVARRSKGSAKGLPRSRWLRRLDEQDQVVEWFKPLTRPKWLTEAQFDELPDSRGALRDRPAGVSHAVDYAGDDPPRRQGLSADVAV